jgi:glycerophosphoryl diester phosphodiesterase
VFIPLNSKIKIFGAVVLILQIATSCVKEYPQVDVEVYGHAGESIYPAKSKYPPNTSKSIERALYHGAHGVELDVQLTADNVLVVYHDSYLEDNSESQGCINSRDFDEIREVKVYNTNHQIEALADVIKIPLNQGKNVMLDIKNYNFCTEEFIDYGNFDNILNILLEQYSNQQKELITINSTSYQLLSSLTDPNIKTSLELDDVEESIQLAIQNGFDMVTLKLFLIDESLRELISLNGLDLCIFYVKTKADINDALHLDPDLIITDNIPKTLKAING